MKSSGQSSKKLLFAEEKLESTQVLDMTCGVGRNSIELQKKSFEVVDVDKTSDVEDAKRKTNQGK